MQVEWKWWIKISDAMSNIEGWVKEYEYKFENFRLMCYKFAKIKENKWIECWKIRWYGKIQVRIL